MGEKHNRNNILPISELYTPRKKKKKSILSLRMKGNHDTNCSPFTVKPTISTCRFAQLLDT